MAAAPVSTPTTPAPPVAPVTPSAKAVVKAAPMAAVQPWAISKTDSRDDIVAFLKTFQPECHHDGVQLENIRTLTLAEIAALPANTKAVKIQIEAHIGPSARQSNVIVTKVF